MSFMILLLLIATSRNFHSLNKELTKISEFLNWEKLVFITNEVDGNSRTKEFKIDLNIVDYLSKFWLLWSKKPFRLHRKILTSPSLTKMIQCLIRENIEISLCGSIKTVIDCQQISSTHYQQEQFSEEIRAGLISKSTLLVECAQLFAKN